MSFKTKILITCFGVIVFDAVASLWSRVFHFEYTRFVVVSLLIYVGAGFFGAFRRGFFYGVLLGGITGFAGATGGWSISQQIGPFTQWPMPPLGVGFIAITIVIVTIVAVLFSTVGALFCTILRQTRMAGA
jgi:hypothetical protein